MKKKIEKEFVIVGDNNYWYAQGRTGSDLKQVRQSLRLTARGIKAGGVFADDEQLPQPSMLYVFVGEEVARMEV